VSGEPPLVPLARLAGTTPHCGGGWDIHSAVLCASRPRVAEWFLTRNSPAVRLRITDIDDGSVRADHGLRFVPREARFSPSGSKLLIVGRGAGSWRDLTMLADSGKAVRLGDRGDTVLPGACDGEWRSRAEVLAGAWLDEDTALLAGRTGDQCWTARLHDMRRVTMVWARAPGADSAQDWAACADTGRAVFSVRSGDTDKVDVVDYSPVSGLRVGLSWHWLVPRPASMRLSADGERFAWSTGRNVPRAIHIGAQYNELRCPPYGYAGPVRAAEHVVVDGDLIVASDGNAFWACYETARGYRYCAPPVVVDGRVCDLVNRDGRFYLAVAGAGRPVPCSVYELTDPVVQLLACGAAEDRTWAGIRLAEHHPGPSSVEPLGQIARHADEEAGRVAIRAIAAVNTTESAAELARVVAGLADDWRQQAVADAAALADKDVLASSLAELLCWAEVDVRLGAARIASDARISADVAPQLFALLNDQDARVRHAAARAAGVQVGLPGVVHLLTRIHDQDADAREAVREALTGILTGSGLMTAGTVGGGDVWEELPGLVTGIVKTGRMDAGSASPDRGRRIVAAVTRALNRAGCAPLDTLNALEALARTGADGRKIALAIAAALAAEPLRDPQADARRLSGGAAIAVQAVRFAETAGGPGLRWRLAAMLGDYETRRAAAAGAEAPVILRRAAGHYAEAMSIIDAMWAELVEEDMLRGFFADKAALYDNAMWCSLRLGHDTAAYEILEKSKTRYLGDLIARRHSDPARRLEPSTRLFWQAARAPEGQVPAARGRFISGLETIVEPGRLSPARELPERFATLALLVQPNPNYSWATDMAAQIWRYAARLAAPGQEEAAAYPTGIKDYFAGVREALTTLRSALEVSADTGPGLGQYDNAVRADYEELGLYDGNDGYPWALTEYGGHLHSAVAGDPALARAVIDALLEVTGYATGELITVIRQDQAGIAAGDFSMPHVMTARIDAYAETHWKEVARIARGETAGIAEAIALLDLQPDTALIEFAVTNQGTVVFLTAGTSGLTITHPLDRRVCPEVTEKSLHERLSGEAGWLWCCHEATKPPHLRSKTEAWEKATDELADWLYTSLFQPILPWLKARAIRRLIVIPHRGLHMVPLGAWRPEGSRRYVIDDYDVSYAPSLTIRGTCDRRRDRSSGNTHLVSVCAGPTLTLAEARKAAEALRPDQHTPLAYGNADRSHWSGASPDATHTHYAGHARYLQDDPLSSYLELSDAKLTLGHLFDGTIPLPRARFTALSACETTMTDPGDPADEYLAVSAGFVFGGSPVVLSTLWTVENTAALLLSARFYQELAGRRPSSALARAQSWLREATNHAVTRELQRMLTDDLLSGERKSVENALRNFQSKSRYSKPFRHPVNWAAFIISGIDEPQP